MIPILYYVGSGRLGMVIIIIIIIIIIISTLYAITRYLSVFVALISRL